MAKSVRWTVRSKTCEFEATLTSPTIAMDLGAWASQRLHATATVTGEYDDGQAVELTYANGECASFEQRRALK